MLDRILKLGNPQFLIFTEGEQTEKDHVGETCNMHGEENTSTRKIILKILTEETTWDLDVKRRIIIK